MSAALHLLQRLRRRMAIAWLTTHVRQLTAAIHEAEAAGHGGHPDVVALRQRRTALSARLLDAVALPPARAARHAQPLTWGL